MAIVPMTNYKILGARAEEAAAYIDERVGRLTDRGADNHYFDVEYNNSVNAIKREAAEKFSVIYRNLWEE